MNKYYKKILDVLDKDLNLKLPVPGDNPFVKSYKERLENDRVATETCVSIKRESFGTAMLRQYICYGNPAFFAFSDTMRILSEALDKFPFDNKTISNILLSVASSVSINIENTTDEPIFIPDLTATLSIYFPAVISQQEMYSYLTTNPAKIIERISDKNFLKLINYDCSAVFMDLGAVIKQIEIIKDNYSKIKDSFDVSNIANVLYALSTLGVSTKHVKIVEKELLYQLFERVKKDAIKEQTPIVIKKEPKPSKYLSDKEYRAILKEINKYYNPSSGKLTDEILTSEKREYIASLMIQIGVEQEQLLDFLSKTEMVEKTYTYDYFKDHVEEFEFYFGEELEQVKAYMEEITLCVSDEDKEYWIMGINEELDKLKSGNKLNSYEYETKLLVQSKNSDDE